MTTRLVRLGMTTRLVRLGMTTRLGMDAISRHCGESATPQFADRKWDAFERRFAPIAR